MCYAPNKAVSGTPHAADPSLLGTHDVLGNLKNRPPRRLRLEGCLRGAQPADGGEKTRLGLPHLFEESIYLFHVKSFV